MKVLVISVTCPIPPESGTSVRTYHLLRQLSQRHSVTLVAQHTHPSGTCLEPLRAMVDEFYSFAPEARNNTSSTWAKMRRLADFVTSGTPPNVASREHLEMKEMIDRLVASRQHDVLTCEHAASEIFVQDYYRKRLPTVVNIHSSAYYSCLHRLQTGTSDNVARDMLSLPLLTRYEKEYCKKFSGVVVTTPEDKAKLESMYFDGPIYVVSNGVDLNQFTFRSHDPGGHVVAFAGAMNYKPNVDAAVTLAKKILPELKLRYPDCRLVIIGAEPVREVEELANTDGIVITGRVECVSDHLHRATVSVVPLSTGYGIKNKTLEAMAAGVPVVGSRHALEGLPMGDPPIAVEANSRDEYVAAISRLFDDAELRQTLASNARAYVESQHTWTQVGRQYEQALLDQIKV